MPPSKVLLGKWSALSALIQSQASWTTMLICHTRSAHETALSLHGVPPSTYTIDCILLHWDAPCAVCVCRMLCHVDIGAHFHLVDVMKDTSGLDFKPELLHFYRSCACCYRHNSVHTYVCIYLRPKVTLKFCFTTWHLASILVWVTALHTDIESFIIHSVCINKSSLSF